MVGKRWKRVTSVLAVAAILFSSVYTLNDRVVVADTEDEVVAESEGEIYYSPNGEYTLKGLADGTYEIKYFDAMIRFPTGNEFDLVVPNTVDGHKITSVGEYAYRSLSCFKSITIEEGIVEIQSNAFVGNNNVVTLHFPNTLKKIGSEAFSKCSLLQEVHIPQSVQTIGSQAFYSSWNRPNFYVYSTTSYASDAFSGNVIIVAAGPTTSPTKKATVAPTKKATDTPTPTPTKKSTVTPTPKTTVTPTKKATVAPTKKATVAPTKAVTAAPTKKATATPTKKSGTPTPTKKVTATPTVKVSAPSNVKATASSPSTVNISWTPAPNTDFVQVWRTHKANAQQSEYVLLGTYYASDAKSVSKSLVPGKTYYYKLRSYKKLSNGTNVYSGYSTIVSATPKISAPTGVKVTATTSDSISLSWNKITGTNILYEVWRLDSPNNTPGALLGIYTGTTKTSTSLKSQKTYYYRVRAYYYYYDAAGEIHRVYSGYSSLVSAKTK
ncbi:MAG: leucine-rich repeat protein [Clostridiales bacterium]|nr:leucine-rich repeat protein [Clostridiales bacterium]